MKIKILFFSIILLLFASNIFGQKTTPDETVREFYKFHLAHQNILNAQEIKRRQRFFTPRLQKLFADELKRQTLYLQKHPDDKPFFEGLPFQPIEFCSKDYNVENARIEQLTATVKINFVYGKSSCKASDGTKIFYEMSLQKINGKWLIDDVKYDDGKTLTDDFNEARKIN